MIAVQFLGDEIPIVAVANFSMLVLLTIKATLFFIWSIITYRRLNAVYKESKTREAIGETDRLEMEKRVKEMGARLEKMEELQERQDELLEVVKEWAYSARNKEKEAAVVLAKVVEAADGKLSSAEIVQAVAAVPAKTTDMVVEAMRSVDSVVVKP